MTQKLLIQDFEVWAHLGCDAKEQEIKQSVILNLEVIFHQPVAAAISDRFEEAIDYVTLADIARVVASKKNYHLIEHLNLQILEAIAAYLKIKNVGAELKLTVKKTKVPIENLRNGVVFSCETKS